MFDIEFNGWCGFIGGVEAQKVSLKPITIFVGPHSSGKSSLIELIQRSFASLATNVILPVSEHSPYNPLGFNNLFHRDSLTLRYPHKIDLNMTFIDGYEEEATIKSKIVPVFYGDAEVSHAGISEFSMESKSIIHQSPILTNGYQHLISDPVYHTPWFHKTHAKFETLYHQSIWLRDYTICPRFYHKGWSSEFGLVNYLTYHSDILNNISDWLNALRKVSLFAYETPPYGGKELFIRDRRGSYSELDSSSYLKNLVHVLSALTSRTITQSTPYIDIIQYPEFGIGRYGDEVMNNIFQLLTDRLQFAAPESYTLIETDSKDLLDDIFYSMWRGSVSEKDVALYYVDCYSPEPIKRLQWGSYRVAECVDGGL